MFWSEPFILAGPKITVFHPLEALELLSIGIPVAGTELHPLAQTL